MAKSALYRYFWWIDEEELGMEKPTIFKLRQMSKRDVDEQMEREKQNAILRAYSARLKEEKDQGDVVALLQKTLAVEGFNRVLYKSCVVEIKNIEVYNDEKDEYEFRSSVTDPEEISNIVAGLENLDLGKRLDDVIWRNSVLEPFEAKNFTLPVGSVRVYRTATGDQTKEPSTATNVDLVVSS